MNKESLGDYLDEYQTVSKPVIWIILLGLIAGLTAALVGLVLRSSLGAGLAFCLLAGLLGWLTWQETGRRVTIHQKGVRLNSRRGERQIYWTDIAEVKAVVRPTGEEMWRISEIQLKLANSEEPARLGRVGDRTGKLLQALQEGTRQNLVEQYLARIRRGEEIAFSEKLKLSPAGIRQGRTFESWPVLGEIQPHSFWLNLYRSDGSLAMIIDLHRLSNAHLFAEVLAFYRLWGLAHPPAAGEVEDNQLQVSWWDIFQQTGKVIAITGAIALAGVVMGTIVGQVLHAIVELTPETMLGIAGAVGVAGMILALVFQFGGLGKKASSRLILAILGIATGAIFGFWALRLSQLFFPSWVSGLIALGVAIMIGWAISFDQLETIRGQLIFRATVGSISAVFFGYLAAGLVGSITMDSLGYIAGMLVGLITLRQIFKLPFVRLLTSMYD